MYRRQHLTSEQRGWLGKGWVYCHGTHIEALARILTRGFIASEEEGASSIASMGGRIQQDRVGVYMFGPGAKQSRWIGNGYSTFVHLFGDGKYWAVDLVLLADYDKRIKLRRKDKSKEKKQIVIPPASLCIYEIRMHVYLYQDLP